MEHLLAIKEDDVNPGAEPVDPTDFGTREAARAIVLNKRGEVFLLNVSKCGYHKLPGGGVDEGEDISRALEREMLEEIGCQAEVTGEVGIIIEYRDQRRLKQTSYCYLAKRVGSEQTNALTEEEISEGFERVMAINVAEAIKILEQDSPNNYEGKFIRLRDLHFLKTVQSSL